MADTTQSAALLLDANGNVDRVRTTDGQVYYLASTIAMDSAEAAQTAAADCRTAIDSANTAEEKRVAAEETRSANEKSRISAEQARESAAADAVAQALSAASGAEKVNATVSGTKLTVTDRTGAPSTVDTKGAKGDKGDTGEQGLPGAVVSCTSEEVGFYLDGKGRLICAKYDENTGMASQTLSLGQVYYPETVADTNRNALAIIGQYEGRDLSVVLADEIGTGTVYDALHKRIAAGSFSGLRVGDYIDVPLVDYASVAGQSSVRFVIAHFDPYYLCGDYMNDHHIAFVASAQVNVSASCDVGTGTSFLQWNMNEKNQGTASVNCPYLASTLKFWETAFAGCLPESLTQYLLTRKTNLEKRYSSSGTLTASNGLAFDVDLGKVWSLSEVEVFGQTVWGTIGFSAGNDCQFDFFRDSAHRAIEQKAAYGSWWLRTVDGEGSYDACSVDDDGTIRTDPVDRRYNRPRPCFLLG